MGVETDDAIRNLIVEKVRVQLSTIMKEDEIQKLVIEEIAQFQTEGTPQRRKLLEWVKEELHNRIRQIISNELTNPQYYGTTWGDAGQFWKEVIKENADSLVSAMFAKVLEEAKVNITNHLAQQISRGY